MSEASVSLVYLGTSDFAAVVLRALAESDHRPVLVVTPPDRPRGRGRKLAAPPVADLANELGLALHQTSSVNEPASIAAIRETAAELGCVCAFGQLIKEPLISDFPMLNVHPSLLPRWRGAAPIQRAIMAGDERTGVCVMQLTAGLDSGPVALSEECVIPSGANYGDLAEILAELGGRLLVRALDQHAQGTLVFNDQGQAGVTYAEKIDAADRRLDFSGRAPGLELVVRALTPHIGAFLELEGGERLGVLAAEAVAGTLDPGTVEAREGRLLVGCAEGALAISELRPAGGRAMAAADWIRGHQVPSRVPVQ